MTINDRGIESGSELDRAIEQALEGAKLRAADSLGTSTASVVEDREPSAVEVGDGAAGFDGD